MTDAFRPSGPYPASIPVVGGLRSAVRQWIACRARLNMHREDALRYGPSQWRDRMILDEQTELDRQFHAIVRSLRGEFAERRRALAA